MTAISEQHAIDTLTALGHTVGDNPAQQLRDLAAALVAQINQPRTLDHALAELRTSGTVPAAVLDYERLLDHAIAAVTAVARLDQLQQQARILNAAADRFEADWGTGQ